MAMTKRLKNFPVAIVGMHGRFPDAYDVKDFWTNLYEGNDTIGLIPKERWDWEKLFGSSANESESTTINCAAFMPLVDRFDHRFFGIMPREAEAMDPQQRLFLQTAYAALEDAGYAPASLSGSNTGIFVGIGNADYPMMMRRDGAVFDIYRATGLALTCIANRVSFSLGVHGPSESIDTACSGSLVAIHRAIQSMQYGECDRAIVGGVNLLAGPDLFIAFDKAGMLSKSARSRTFDAGANGYVRGEGVAALVLCPLDEAEKNGDYIYAVIQGSAVNHGGRAHSFTAPNTAAQAQVIKAAWENSGKDFHDACMIETHGTGTPLGDPIEVNGLKKVSEEFGLSKKKTAKQPHIALGALKSHVGHMEATAGVGGVIKAALSMKYRVIPKNLNYATLNPHIDLSNTPYFIPTQNIDLNDTGTELLAGVSSFGFGGVNSHVVVQSYDADHGPEKKQAVEQPYLIPLSGKDKNSLHGRVQQLILFLEASCNIGEGATYEAIMASFCSSLHVEADAVSPQPITLASINASPMKWMKALKALMLLIDRRVDVNEVQDCVSLQEAARKIIRNIQVDNIVRGSEQLSLCSRIALPEIEVRAVGLDRIAYSLMQGRDHYKERLVCIVRSKEELLKLLRAYIQAPDEPHESLWVHSIRGNDPAIEQPTARTAHNDIEPLVAWAAWWLGTKSAGLAWEALYPNTEKPRKFPLPAYPFQLDHIWYKPAQPVMADGPVLPEIKAPAQHGANTMQQPLSLPSGMAEAWDACIQQSQLIVPSSVMSLGYLLDYAHHKHRGAIHLQDMVFGRPCSISDEDTVFGHASGGVKAGSVVQCFVSKTAPRILSQAVLMNASRAATEPSIAAFTSTASLSTDQFLAQLKNKHLSLGPILHCIERVHTGDQRLKLELRLPSWKAKDSRFWVPLVASMLAGLAYLHRQHNKPFQLPWKIRSVAFNPEHAGSIRALYLEFDTIRNQSLVVATDESASLVLSLEGMLLRESAVVRLPSKSAGEVSSDKLRVGAL